MNENPTDCGYADDLNPFVVGNLSEERRTAFEKHLPSCACCLPLLEALGEDERLALAPLTPEERRQVRTVIESGKRVFQRQIEQDCRIRQSAEAIAGPRFVGWQSSRSWRALFLALLAALFMILVLWCYGGRQGQTG